MKWNARLWKNSVAQFSEFMTPLVATLGRSERRQAATHYVEGLLMPGPRKSIEPRAARLGIDSQSLQQLVRAALGATTVCGGRSDRKSFPIGSPWKPGSWMRPVGSNRGSTRWA